MTQLWAWEYEGKTEVGTQKPGNSCVFKSAASEAIPILRHTDHITNLRKVKVVDEDAIVITAKHSICIGGIRKKRGDYVEIIVQVHESEVDNFVRTLDPIPPVTKTYLTTDQFIKVWKSLDDAKVKQLSAAWDAPWSAGESAAWDVARDADLAVLAKDKITAEQFEILTSPWTSCGLSLYAEDWEEVLNPKVVEPKNFGAVVEAQYYRATLRTRFFFNGVDWIRERTLENHDWSDLIDPTIISEGVEG